MDNRYQITFLILIITVILVTLIISIGLNFPTLAVTCTPATWQGNPWCGVENTVWDNLCNPWGTGWIPAVKEICPSGQTCSNGVCVGGGQICTPGQWLNQPWCYADAVWDKQCNLDGTTWQSKVKERCATGQICQNGQCIAVQYDCTNPPGSPGQWQNQPYCVWNSVYDNKCINGQWTPTLVITCMYSYVCQNGECIYIPGCSNPTGSIGDWQNNPWCQGNDIYDYKCVNPGVWINSFKSSCPSGQVCSGGTCYVCNNNGVCDIGETAQSCPQDCKEGFDIVKWLTDNWMIILIIIIIIFGMILVWRKS